MRILPLALLALSLPLVPLSAQPAGPAQPAAAPATPVDPRAISATLADRLAADFVFPEQGARYASHLRSRAAAGAFDGLQGAALAERLSTELQGVAADGHLRVMFGGMGGAMHGSPGGGPRIIIKRAPAAGDSPIRADGQPRMVRFAMPTPMEQPRWLTAEIAFVRFNLFPGDPAVVAAANEFMASHADAKVIIFDLRTHMGGGLAEMDVIFPWLFAKPAHLVTMATRRSVDEAGGSPVGAGPSLRPGAADPDFVAREHWVTPGTDKRLHGAKVFVLTSGRTGSAAEHFALALKTTGRGTLIGQPTAGANHFGGEQQLGGGFTAFVPVGRTSDPATGKDWEGTGVAPDVLVPAADALVKALTMAGLPPEKAAALSAEVAPTMPMVRPGAP